MTFTLSHLLTDVLCQIQWQSATSSTMPPHLLLFWICCCLRRLLIGHSRPDMVYCMFRVPNVVSNVKIHIRDVSKWYQTTCVEWKPVGVSPRFCLFWRASYPWAMKIILAHHSGTHPAVRVGGRGLLVGLEVPKLTEIWKWRSCVSFSPRFLFGETTRWFWKMYHFFYHFFCVRPFQWTSQGRSDLMMISFTNPSLELRKAETNLRVRCKLPKSIRLACFQITTKLGIPSICSNINRNTILNHSLNHSVLEKTYWSFHGKSSPIQILTNLGWNLPPGWMTSECA